ncbi:MAG: TIGR01244 family sulfur transferase [Methylophilus sp.]|nr:TIGR01244 family sulfur transferase [Methylophilus sp.]
MPLNINKITENYCTTAQISTEDIAEIAALGFKTIINNRPDHEGGAEQPTSATIKQHAEQIGIQYHHIPVIPNQIQAQQIDAFTQAFATAPKPILAFCRTGNRAARMLELAQAKQANQ